MEEKLPLKISCNRPISSTLRMSEVQDTLVQKTQWRYCRRWRHECADRWGWRTPGYFRCLARHGC